MINDLLILTKSQKILFYSTMISVIVRVLCVYFLIEHKNKFRINHCLGYIIFTTISYLFYYKIVLP